MNQRLKENPWSLSVTSLIVLVLLLLSGSGLDSAGGCLGVGFHVPDLLVLENEPFARIWLYRERTDVLQTVDYYTADGGLLDSRDSNAKAGIHYVSRSGTATFALGESATSVDVPLIDNGLMDGSKDFLLVFTNQSPGLRLNLVWNPVWIRILDNEISAAVDPLFVPDVPNSAFPSPNPDALTPLPDGRVLVATESRLPTMLLSNGWVDVNFDANIAASFKTGSLRPLKALSDGRILAIVSDSDNSQRIARLSPSGNVEASFLLRSNLSFAAAQTDGQILVFALTNHLKLLGRLASDGSLDLSFPAVPVDFINSAKDQTLIVRSNMLTRLSLDGRPDSTFAPKPFDEQINYVLPRKNGTVIVQYGSGIAQLTVDGDLDANFRYDFQTPGGVMPRFELDDGRLLSGPGSAIMWDSDGSFDARFHPGIIGFNTCWWVGPEIGPVEAGQILVSGPIETVDGFPRRGLARLLANPPEREFRVITPAEFQESSSHARIRVVRTGPTTNSASISFSTLDGTAKAGEDYSTETGVLTFAAMEVSKEVVIPLQVKTPIQERRYFRLELSNPSAGYTKISSTLISILPDVHVSADEAVSRSDGSVSLTLLGTVPGKTYSLEASADLKHWYDTSARPQTASGPVTVFESVLVYNPSSETFVPPIGKLPHFVRALKN